MPLINHKSNVSLTTCDPAFDALGQYVARFVSYTPDLGSFMVEKGERGTRMLWVMLSQSFLLSQ